MTIETDFLEITATKDSLRMLAHYMDRAVFYYEGVDCLAFESDGM